MQGVVQQVSETDTQDDGGQLQEEHLAVHGHCGRHLDWVDWPGGLQGTWESWRGWRVPMWRGLQGSAEEMQENFGREVLPAQWDWLQGNSGATLEELFQWRLSRYLKYWHKRSNQTNNVTPSLENYGKMRCSRRKGGNCKTSSKARRGGIWKKTELLQCYRKWLYFL